MKYAPLFPIVEPGHKPDEYPFKPRPVQRTRCVLALSAIQVFTGEVFPADLPANIRRRIAKIRERLAEVTEEMDKDKPKQLAAPAKKNLTAAIEKIANYCCINQMQAGEADIETWYKAIYLAHLLLADCRAVCPCYYHGNAWGRLFHHLEVLAEYFDAHHPGTADIAGDWHMEVSLYEPWK